jgi:glycosyltransferase involved in cell wall biosynthesis
VPTTLLELAVRGRLTLPTAVGGIPDFFDELPDEARWLLVPSADTRAMADRIAVLLEQPGKRDRLAGILHDHVVAKHSPEAVVERILEVFSEASASRASGWADAGA